MNQHQLLYSGNAALTLYYCHQEKSVISNFVIVDQIARHVRTGFVAVVVVAVDGVYTAVIVATVVVVVGVGRRFRN